MDRNGWGREDEGGHADDDDERLVGSRRKKDTALTAKMAANDSGADECNKGGTGAGSRNFELIPVYTEWVNHHLLRTKFNPLTDLTGELCVPHKLIQLIHAVVFEFQPLPKEQLVRLLAGDEPLGSIRKCLTYCAQIGVRVDNIQAQDIRNGHLGAVLQLLHQLSEYKRQQRQLAAERQIHQRRVHFEQLESATAAVSSSCSQSPKHLAHPHCTVAAASSSSSSNSNNDKSVRYEQSSSSGYSSICYTTVSETSGVRSVQNSSKSGGLDKTSSSSKVDDSSEPQLKQRQQQQPNSQKNHSQQQQVHQSTASAVVDHQLADVQSKQQHQQKSAGAAKEKRSKQHKTVAFKMPPNLSPIPAGNMLPNARTHTAMAMPLQIQQHHQTSRLARIGFTHQTALRTPVAGKQQQQARSASVTAAPQTTITTTAHSSERTEPPRLSQQQQEHCRIAGIIHPNSGNAHLIAINDNRNNREVLVGHTAASEQQQQQQRHAQFLAQQLSACPEQRTASQPPPNAPSKERNNNGGGRSLLQKPRQLQPPSKRNTSATTNSGASGNTILAPTSRAVAFAEAEQANKLIHPHSPPFAPPPPPPPIASLPHHQSTTAAAVPIPIGGCSTTPLPPQSSSNRHGNFPSSSSASISAAPTSKLPSSSSTTTTQNHISNTTTATNSSSSIASAASPPSFLTASSAPSSATPSVHHPNCVVPADKLPAQARPDLVARQQTQLKQPCAPTFQPISPPSLQSATSATPSTRSTTTTTTKSALRVPNQVAYSSKTNKKINEQQGITEKSANKHCKESLDLDEGVRRQSVGNEEDTKEPERIVATVGEKSPPPPPRRFGGTSTGVESGLSLADEKKANEQHFTEGRQKITTMDINGNESSSCQQTCQRQQHSSDSATATTNAVISGVTKEETEEMKKLFSFGTGSSKNHLEHNAGASKDELLCVEEMPPKQEKHPQKSVENANAADQSNRKRPPPTAGPPPSIVEQKSKSSALPIAPATTRMTTTTPKRAIPSPNIRHHTTQQQRNVAMGGIGCTSSTALSPTFASSTCSAELSTSNCSNASDPKNASTESVFVPPSFAASVPKFVGTSKSSSNSNNTTTTNRITNSSAKQQQIKKQQNGGQQQKCASMPSSVAQSMVASTTSSIVSSTSSIHSAISADRPKSLLHPPSSKLVRPSGIPGKMSAASTAIQRRNNQPKKEEKTSNGATKMCEISKSTKSIDLDEATSATANSPQHSTEKKPVLAVKGISVSSTVPSAPSTPVQQQRRRPSAPAAASSTTPSGSNSGPAADQSHMATVPPESPMAEHRRMREHVAVGVVSPMLQQKQQQQHQKQQHQSGSSVPAAENKPKTENETKEANLGEEQTQGQKQTSSEMVESRGEHNIDENNSGNVAVFMEDKLEEMISTTTTTMLLKNNDDKAMGEKQQQAQNTAGKLAQTTSVLPRPGIAPPKPPTTTVTKSTTAENDGRKPSESLRNNGNSNRSLIGCLNQRLPMPMKKHTGGAGRNGGVPKTLELLDNNNDSTVQSNRNDGSLPTDVEQNDECCCPHSPSVPPPLAPTKLQLIRGETQAFPCASSSSSNSSPSDEHPHHHIPPPHRQQQQQFDLDSAVAAADSTTSQDSFDSVQTAIHLPYSGICTPSQQQFAGTLLSTPRIASPNGLRNNSKNPEKNNGGETYSLEGKQEMGKLALQQQPIMNERMMKANDEQQHPHLHHQEQVVAALPDRMALELHALQHYMIGSDHSGTGAVVNQQSNQQRRYKNNFERDDSSCSSLSSGPSFDDDEISTSDLTTASSSDYHLGAKGSPEKRQMVARLDMAAMQSQQQQQCYRQQFTQQQGSSGSNVPLSSYVHLHQQRAQGITQVPSNALLVRNSSPAASNTPMTQCAADAQLIIQQQRCAPANGGHCGIAYVDTVTAQQQQQRMPTTMTAGGGGAGAQINPPYIPATRNNANLPSNARAIPFTRNYIAAQQQQQLVDPSTALFRPYHTITTANWQQIQQQHQQQSRHHHPHRVLSPPHNLMVLSDDGDTLSVAAGDIGGVATTNTKQQMQSVGSKQIPIFNASRDGSLARPLAQQQQQQQSQQYQNESLPRRHPAYHTHSLDRHAHLRLFSPAKQPNSQQQPQHFANISAGTFAGRQPPPMPIALPPTPGSQTFVHHHKLPAHLQTPSDASRLGSLLVSPRHFAVAGMQSTFASTLSNKEENGRHSSASAAPAIGAGSYSARPAIGDGRIYSNLSSTNGNVLHQQKFSSSGTSSGLNSPNRIPLITTNEIVQHHQQQPQPGSQPSLASSMGSTYSTIEERYEWEINKLHTEMESYRTTVTLLNQRHTGYNCVLQLFDQRLQTIMQSLTKLRQKHHVKRDEVEQVCNEIEQLRALSVTAGVVPSAPSREQSAPAETPYGNVVANNAECNNNNNGDNNGSSSDKAAGVKNKAARDKSSNEQQQQRQASVGSGGAKKSWIRSSFSRAFHKTGSSKRSSSKHQAPQLPEEGPDQQQQQHEQCPPPTASTNGKNSASSTCSSSMLGQSLNATKPPEVQLLKKELEDKELALTDVQLDALDKAKEIDILRETVSRLRHENRMLKYNFTLLERHVRSESRTSSHLSLNTNCCADGGSVELDVGTLDENQLDVIEQLASSAPLYDIVASSPSSGDLSLNTTTTGSSLAAGVGGNSRAATTTMLDPQHRQLHQQQQQKRSSIASSTVSSASKQSLQIGHQPAIMAVKVVLCVDLSGRLDDGSTSSSFPSSSSSFSSQQPPPPPSRSLASISRANSGSCSTISSQLSSSTMASVLSGAALTTTKQNQLQNRPQQHQRRELTIGHLQLPIPLGTSWAELDQQLGLMLEDYLHRIDPDLALAVDSYSSIIGYQVHASTIDSNTKYTVDGAIGEFCHIRRRAYSSSSEEEENGEFGEIVPKMAPTDILYPGSLIRLRLKGVAQHSVDSLVMESLFPRHLLEQLLHHLEKHRRLLLFGPTGIGKSNIARLLAKYKLMQMGLEPAGGIMEIRFPANENEEAGSDEKNKQIKEQLISTLRHCSTPSTMTTTSVAIILMDNLPWKHLDTVLDAFRTAASFSPLTDPPSLFSASHRSLPFVICTLNRATLMDHSDAVQQLQLHHNFRLYQLNQKMDAISGYMGRYLRRRLAEQELSNLHISDDQQHQSAVASFEFIIEFLGRCLRHINEFIEQRTATGLDVTLGPRILLQCPLDAEQAREWFIHIWNHKLVPYIQKMAPESKDSIDVTTTGSGVKNPLDGIVAAWPWPDGTELLHSV